MSNFFPQKSLISITIRMVIAVIYISLAIFFSRFTAIFLGITVYLLGVWYEQDFTL